MPPKSVQARILPRRFELIKKMYTSDKVIAANKKDLIFNWFFEQFGKVPNKTSSYVYESLWKTFYEILLLEKNQSSGHRILVKSNALVTLVNTVAAYPFTYSWSSIILSCVTTLLQTPTINAALIADVEKIHMLLIGSLKIICKIVEDNNNDITSRKEAENLANVTLDILENLPASNDEQKALLLSDYLQDVAVFTYLATDDMELDYLNEKLSRRIISVIFNLKKKSFETLLTPAANSDAIERPNPNILKFFSTLQTLLMNEGMKHYSVFVSVASASLIGRLLSTFLKQNKSSLNSLKVASLLFAVVGLDIPIVITTSSCCKYLFKQDEKKKLDLSICGLSHLLEACSTVPQYFTNVAVPQEYLKPSIWLKGVSAVLLDVKVSKSKALWLKCFHSLLTISPTIIDSDIVQLIKIVLLNISVHSEESKKQYCELFNIVLQTHSKLHQVPKFFVKLLLALTDCIKENCGGNLLINGQIYPEVLESIASCIQELPHGQMIELWKIFIETFSTLENMSQAFNVSKGFIFFVAQLFSTFLLHAQLFQSNIPTNINAQFSTLIESTCDEIKKNISALKEVDSKIVPLQNSILLLCYAVGEVKFLYNANLEKPLISKEHPLSDEVFDFSAVHSYLDQDYSSILEKFMTSDEKIRSYLVFKLMLQKIKVVDFWVKFSDSADLSSENHTPHLQQWCTIVLKHLQDSTDASESWDLDMCTINAKNYGSAFWMDFLKITQLIFDHSQPKDIYNFCCLAQDIILHNDECETKTKPFVLSLLKFGDFQDLKNFQTAFISAIWRQNKLLYAKKRSHDEMEAEETPIDRIFTLLNGFKKNSLKYAQRCPKSDKNLGKMWDDIKEISDHLNNILLSESLPKCNFITKNVNEMIKLINILPLQYLLPGNQMKSVMGLSLIFFLIPQSCSADEAILLSKEISQILLIIFEGTRSIWLFDFVASGPYLKFVVKTIESVLMDKFDDDCEWAVQLLEHLVALAVKSTDTLSGLKTYISEIASKDSASKSVLIILHALIKKFLQILQHSYLQEKYRETLIQVSLLTLQAFMQQMKNSFNDSSESSNHCYFIKCYMQAIEIISSYSEAEQFSKDCYELIPTVYEKAFINASSSNVDTLSDVYLLFISKICKNSSKLSSFLPKDFIDTSWKIVFSHFENRREMKINFFKANQNSENTDANPSNVVNNSFCVLCSTYLNSIPSMKVYKSQNSAFLSTDKSFSSFTLNEFEVECIKELSVITPVETLEGISQRLLKEMDCLKSGSQDIISLPISILILRCLIDSSNEKFMQPPLNNLLQQCLSQLHYIINQACGSLLCHTMVILPVLDSINYIIQGNRGFSKQVLFQNLNCIASVSLEVQDDDDYSLFVLSFDAVWKIVYNLFVHHTSVILTSPAPFLSYVTKLLKSIVRASSSASLCKCDPEVFQQVQLCGQNMNRLLTVISRNKNEFSKLVPYLIADYVSTVQHITLETSLKESLLSGIYRLLDICSEHSVKMLSVNVNYVCREIYTNLVKNHRRNKQIAV